MNTSLPVAQSLLPDAIDAVQKALAVNLNPAQYGSIVEIGAGQEVARYFFRAGGAAGTVAKTMSAYDMTFSDAIYGRAPGGRYVSRSRLGRMLEHEFGLLIERLEGRRESETTFFAYAATVAAQSYKHRSECHGWLGVRLQLTPGGPPNDIVLHVRMLDEDARVSQLRIRCRFSRRFSHPAKAGPLNSIMSISMRSEPALAPPERSSARLSISFSGESAWLKAP